MGVGTLGWNCHPARIWWQRWDTLAEVNGKCLFPAENECPLLYFFRVDFLEWKTKTHGSERCGTVTNDAPLHWARDPWINFSHASWLSKRRHQFSHFCENVMKIFIISCLLLFNNSEHIFYKYFIISLGLIFPDGKLTESWGRKFGKCREMSRCLVRHGLP